MMSAFEGKVALITGASSGIGYGTALALSAGGCAVAVSGRNEVNLGKLRDECLSANEHAKVLVIVADVTVEEDVERMVKTVVDHFSHLDILVNNAGIWAIGDIESTSLQQYDNVMNTNVRSVYHISMLCVPHLIATEGCIVNISSIAGIRALPGAIAYGVSKAAIDQMTRCMALELASKQVRVNAVNPGVIITEIHKRAGMSEEEYQGLLEHSKVLHPLGRPGIVGEVVEAICFLADKKRSSFMTGNLLPVDGGWHAACPDAPL